MNTFRTISRVLVVTTAVLGGSLYCIDFDAIAEKALGRNANTVIASLLESQACKKDDHFKKACIDTVGHTLDTINDENRKKLMGEKSKTKLDLLKKEGFNLGANYVVRKGSEYISENYISLDSLGKKCDVLPEGIIRDTVNPIVRGAAEIATHPQMIICLISSIYGNYGNYGN
jgi:hypothetical protein